MQSMIDKTFAPGPRHGMCGTCRLLLYFALFACLPAVAATPDANDLSLEDLMQVPVIGASKYLQKQSEVAAAVSVVTRDEIKAFGWRTLGDVLASLPGVYSTYDRQYSYLGMRGFGLPGDLNTRTLILINGNRVNDPVFDQGPTGYDLPLDLDLIERIEFIPGPGGAVYGQNAMFGVVNLVTRTGEAVNSAEVAVAHDFLSQQNKGQAIWGSKLANGTDMLLSVSELRATGQDLFFNYGAAGVSGNATGEDGERDVNLLARLARGPWSLEVESGRHRKDDPTGAYLSTPLVPGQFQQDARTVAQLRYNESFADDKLQVLARVFGGSEDYSDLFYFGSPFTTPAYGKWVGAEVRLLSTSIGGHKLMVGTELQRNVQQDQYSIDFTHPTNDISIPGSGFRAGVYVQDEWRITKDLTAISGLRFDRIQNNAWEGDQITWKASPRIGLIWMALPATTLKALYGSAYRAPNAFERDYQDNVTQVANPALNGETIDTLEFVADQRVGTDAAVRASIYQWIMHNLVTLGIDPVSGLSQYQSGGNTQARGVELSGDKTWQRDTRLRGSVSLQHVTDAQGVHLSNSPSLLGKLNLSTPLHVAGLRAGYELDYDSARRTLDGNETGGYVLSNITLSTQSLASGLELSMAIYNLFDKRYAQPASSTNWQNVFEQDGRNVGIKLTYAF
jgi:outer membrane receptor protein involved in Fe transport